VPSSRTRSSNLGSMARTCALTPRGALGRGCCTAAGPGSVYLWTGCGRVLPQERGLHPRHAGSASGPAARCKGGTRRVLRWGRKTVRGRAGADRRRSSPRWRQVADGCPVPLRPRHGGSVSKLGCPSPCHRGPERRATVQGEDRPGSEPKHCGWTITEMLVTFVTPQKNGQTRAACVGGTTVAGVPAGRRRRRSGSATCSPGYPGSLLDGRYECEVYCGRAPESSRSDRSYFVPFSPDGPRARGPRAEVEAAGQAVGSNGTKHRERASTAGSRFFRYERMSWVKPNLHSGCCVPIGMGHEAGPGGHPGCALSSGGPLADPCSQRSPASCRSNRRLRGIGAGQSPASSPARARRGDEPQIPASDAVCEGGRIPYWPRPAPLLGPSGHARN